MEVIFISGIFMSFFIVILLLTKRKKAITDKILAIWISVIGIHLLGFYYNQAGYWEKYPHLIGLTAPVPLLHGPLLYLYCLYALRGSDKIRRIDYLHFVPVVFAYISMSKFFFFYTARQKILVDRGEIGDYHIFSIILLIAIILSGLGYSLLSLQLTGRHSQSIRNRYSYSEGISLTWLRYCIIGIGMVFVFAAIIFFLKSFLDLSYPFNPEYIFYSIMIAFIFYIGYFGIKHENIFVKKYNPYTTPVTGITVKDKYKKSGVKEDKAKIYYKELLKMMEEEKPYLNPKLNLHDLAGHLGISTNQLSQIINQEAGVNFHDFINRYRVEEFIKRAGENTSFSLLALALDSGFNSKSSFNHIFKKQKGISPSKYLSAKNLRQ